MDTPYTSNAASNASRQALTLSFPSPVYEARTLVRVYTLGALTLEWVGLPEPFPQERLHGRGAASALLLLKALISRPHRYAARDWLCEHLHSGEEDALSPGRLDDLASLLRGLVCPPVEDRALRDRLRRELLSYVHSASESGPGYRLGSYPLIWVDIDALSWYVEQACRLERFGEDALSLWERAYALARRGEYLIDEPYSDWAEPRRAEAARYLRQSVHALAQCYLSLPDARGEEEALRLLGDYWQQHIEDEDALRPLMELLGRHERYQEALSYYARLCEVLEEEDRTPDARTTDLKEFLRTKQLQRSLPRTQVSERVPPVQDQEQPQWPISSAPMFLPRLTQAVIAPSPALDLLATLPASDPDDMYSLGACFALGASNLGALFERGWSIEALLEVLQVILPVVKAMPMITRRTFLQAGAATMFAALSIFEKKQISEEEVMQFCQAFSESIAAGWRLFIQGKNTQALAVSQAQLALLQHVSAALPVNERPALYASVYNFLGMALCNQGCYHEALHAQSNAYIAALGAGDMLGVAYSLLGQANSYFVLTQHSAATETIQQALHTLGALEGSSPQVKAHLLGVWADSAMCVGDYETARQKLDAIVALLDDLGPNEEFDRASWYHLSGKYAYLTGDYATAMHWCEQAWQELPQESIIRRVIVLMPLLATNTVMRDLEASLLTLEKARQIIPALQAPAMNQPLRQGLQGFQVVFPHETSVKAIISDLLQHLR